MGEILGILEKNYFLCWIIFFIIGTLIVFILCTIIIRLNYDKRNKYIMDEKTSLENAYLRVYEPEIFFNSVISIIVSSTCIFATLIIYENLCQLVDFADFADFSSLILLCIILLMIGVNNILDKVWLDKKWSRSIKGDEKYADEKYPRESLRLVSSFFVLVILIFCSLFFKTTSFLTFFVLMLTLLLGRFIYFDATKNSLKESISCICKIWKSAIVAFILMCIYLGGAVYFNILSCSSSPLLLMGIHIFYLWGINMISDICEKV